MGYKIRSGETPAHPCWQRNFDRGVSFGKNCSLAGVTVEEESFADTLIAAGWVEEFIRRANSLSTLSSISSPWMNPWTPFVETKLSVSLLKSCVCLYWGKVGPHLPDSPVISSGGFWWSSAEGSRKEYSFDFLLEKGGSDRKETLVGWSVSAVGQIKQQISTYRKTMKFFGDGDKVFLRDIFLYICSITGSFLFPQHL